MADGRRRPVVGQGDGPGGSGQVALQGVGSSGRLGCSQVVAVGRGGDGTDALLIGSVLAFGYRDQDVGAIPEFSVTLRLIEPPGGKCLWSGTQARAGNDHVSVFGIGRIDNLERLANAAVRDLVATFPKTAEGPRSSNPSQKVEQP